MKSTFAYTIWGIYPSNKSYKNNHFFNRRTKIDNDIKLHKRNPYNSPCVVYVYGNDNFNRMVDLGYNCRLVDSKPICFDMEKEQYAHKIYSWEHALHEFDQVVFLDFDTIFIKPLPADFWSVMYNGNPIRSTIYQYTVRRLPSRVGDVRKLSSASWVYLRNDSGVNHARGIIETWLDGGRNLKEEIPLSEYIDTLNGGWRGTIGYQDWDCPYYELQPIRGIKKMPLKDQIWKHVNSLSVRKLLCSKDLKKELDNMIGGY